MHMLYNSDSYVVVRFDAPADASPPEAAEAARHGGYELVDKFARREIFIQGAMAERFKAGVEALIETRPAGPSEEEMDAYIERYTALMQQPVVLH
jgi:hypothetical protein